MPDRTGQPSARDRHVPWGVVLSYALLIASWIVANPPHGGPDEWSHYLRAVGLGHGQLVGTPSGREGALVIVGPTQPPFLDAKTYEAELTWVAQNTRKVRIPVGLTPRWARCPHNMDPPTFARCVNNAPPFDGTGEWFNPTATYQPFAYLLPAAISRVDASPDHLTRLMRTGKALLAALLLSAAVFLVWNTEARLVSFTGLVVAVTPMAVFLAATLNPSGLEIMAAVAFGCALIRLTRDEVDDRSRRWVWTVAGISGAMLALSRTQGPVWVALSLAAVVPLGGVRKFLRLSLDNARWSVPASIAVLLAIVLNRLWERAYGPHLAFDPTPLVTSISQGIAQLPLVLREQVGVFNYLEVTMPLLAYGLWGALSIALLTVALLIGSRRERLHLLLAGAAAVALPVVLVATTMRHTGFALQGRYVLSFSVVVPLLAGEILVRRYDRLRALDSRQVAVPFMLIAGFVQLVAWWTNARRFAVGIGGPRWFVPSAEWSPPLGWWPWLLLAVAGVGLLMATPILDRCLSRRPAGVSHERPV